MPGLEPLPLKAQHLVLEFSLAPGQANRRGTVAQMVQDRAADMGAGEGLEGCPLAALIAFGGPDQPQQAHLDQVLQRLAGATAVVNGQGPHQGAVTLHEPVAALQGGAVAQPPAHAGGAIAAGGCLEVGQGARGRDRGRRR